MGVIQNYMKLHLIILTVYNYDKIISVASGFVFLTLFHSFV
jgi:hypothetical protein